MSKDKKRIIWLAGVVAAVVAIILLAYQAKGAIYAQLNNLKLIPQPERFTELYFLNSSFLPRETVAKQQMAFAFVIHNVEGVTTTYPYAAYFEYPDGSKTSLQGGIVSLANNASTTISVTHTFRSSNLTGEVVVNLTSLNQQIDFLLPNNN